MGLLQLSRVEIGEVGLLPGSVKMVDTNNLATITAAGYLNGVNNGNIVNGVQLAPSDIIECLYSFNQSTGAGTFTLLSVAISKGVITLSANSGNESLTSGHIFVGNSSNVATDVAMSGDGTISNTGVFTLSSTIANNAGRSFTATTPSAAPGSIRAVKGLLSLTNTTYSNGSNSVAGLRGEVDMVGASAGFVYGVQGKVIPTGTLSGSIWAPAVFGQYDLSAATINGGQIAALWGDMGASGGTFTNVTGARGIALTNTISSLTLFAMDYRYGKATNLFELDGSASTYITAGAATPSGDLKKIAISIDGVTHYILAAAVWS